MTTPTKRIAAAISIALVAAATGPGCGQILGIPDRVQGLNVTCDDATCVCDAGFGDCEDDLGCETGLGDDPAHCGACHHDCAGGGCVDGRCEPAPELFVGELFTGPVVFGDTLFIVDRETGDLLSSPASGPGAFVPARKNPQPTEYESDLFAGPDGLYLLLVPARRRHGQARGPAPLGDRRGDRDVRIDRRYAPQRQRGRRDVGRHLRDRRVGHHPDRSRDARADGGHRRRRLARAGHR